MNMSTAVVVILALGAELAGQAQWAGLGPSPVGGCCWSAVHDETRDRIVTVGPATFEFDGVSWVSTSPQPFLAHEALAFDPMRSRTVAIESGFPRTWEWDGNSWASSPAATPGVVVMCYHPGRRRVVAVTRAAPFQPWGLEEWDGASWSPVPSPVPLPHTRGPVSLIYDESRDKLVSFCPIVAGAYTSETWEWEAAGGWQQATAPGGPTQFQGLGLSLTYDASRNLQVALVWQSPAASNSYVYERSGSGTWTRRTWSGRSGFRGPLLHDGIRNRNVLVDESGNAWSWAVPHPALYGYHGAGCLGSLGEPQLAATDPWTLPWLGSALQFTVDRAPLSLAVVTTGLQDTSWASGSLPLDLSPYGAPGCSWRVSGDANVLLGGAGGKVHGGLLIPLQGALLGVRLYQQALVLDPGGNTLGGAISNSRVLVVGLQ